MRVIMEFVAWMIVIGTVSMIIRFLTCDPGRKRRLREARIESAGTDAAVELQLQADLSALQNETLRGVDADFRHARND